MAAGPIHPPGPSSYSPLGHARSFMQDPILFLTDMTQRYGDVMTFRLGRKRVVQLSNPEHIHQVLVKDNENFEKTGVLKRAKSILGKGLVSSDGEIHKRQRQIIQPIFARNKMQYYCEIVTESTDRWINQLPEEGELDVFASMSELTLDIILHTFFGDDHIGKTAEIESSLTAVLEHFQYLLTPFAHLLEWIPTRRIQRYHAAARKLDAFVEQIIAQNSKPQGCKAESTIIEQLCAGIYSNPLVDNPKEQVRDEVMTLLTAGHETIASALTWTCYLLSRNPTIQLIVREEIDAVLRGRPPTYSDLDRLKCVRNVFAESMRLYPPVWAITRRARNDYVIGGFSVPRGATVAMSQYIVHRDARFHESPNRFSPERWEGRSSNNALTEGYFPFGAGSRVCIGENFAWAEGILVLTQILQRFLVEPVDSRLPELQPLLTLRPKGGLRLRLRRRRKEPTAGQTAVLPS